MSDSVAELAERGYTVVADVLEPAQITALLARIEELFAQEGDRAGWEFRTEPEADRLANLVDKGVVFHQTIAHPRVLPLVRSVLGSELKLSSLNARRARPGSRQGQPLHVDMGLLPDERGPKTCNTVWALTDIDESNGALRVVPGSHRWRKRPQEALKDPLAAHPEQVVVTAKAGDVIVFNAHLWHAGLPNRSERPRTALNVFYCRRDVPQQQWQKRWVSPQVQQQLPPLLRELLALDDPENDRLSADPGPTSGFMKAGVTGPETDQRG